MGASPVDEGSDQGHGVQPTSDLLEDRWDEGCDRLHGSRKWRAISSSDGKGGLHRWVTRTIKVANRRAPTAMAEAAVVGTAVVETAEVKATSRVVVGTTGARRGQSQKAKRSARWYEANSRQIKNAGQTRPSNARIRADGLPLARQ